MTIQFVQSTLSHEGELPTMQDTQGNTWTLWPGIRSDPPIDPHEWIYAIVRSTGGDVSGPIPAGARDWSSIEWFRVVPKPEEEPAAEEQPEPDADDTFAQFEADQAARLAAACTSDGRIELKIVTPRLVLSIEGDTVVAVPLVRAVLNA